MGCSLLSGHTLLKDEAEDPTQPGVEKEKGTLDHGQRLAGNASPRPNRGSGALQLDLWVILAAGSVRRF